MSLFMDRRSFLGLAASFVIFPKSSISPKSRDFGWSLSYNDLYKSLYDISNLENFGKDTVSCLWKAYTSVRKQPWTAHQQEWGDCVGQATGSGLDILTCCRIVLEHKCEEYVADSSTDMIYAGGRQLAGRKRSIGMNGFEAIDWLKQYGNLLRLQYSVNGKNFDLRPYSKETCRQWDRNGVPNELKDLAKKHPLIEAIQVKSWEEARDSVSSGHPVLLCGDQFGAENDKRDDDGFIKPSGSWSHAWLIAGVQDGRRPGACLINSHGPDFGTGPKTFDQPDGSVWVDAKYIDKQIKKHYDSYALTDYRGFEAPNRNYIIW